jgi:hypothetical protein
MEKAEQQIDRAIRHIDDCFLPAPLENMLTIMDYDVDTAYQ